MIDPTDVRQQVWGQVKEEVGHCIRYSQERTGPDWIIHGEITGLNQVFEIQAGEIKVRHLEGTPFLLMATMLTRQEAHEALERCPLEGTFPGATSRGFMLWGGLSQLIANKSSNLIGTGSGENCRSSIELEVSPGNLCNSM